MSRRMRVVGSSGDGAAVRGVATAGVAEGAKVKNGNFEKGTFKNWKTKISDSAIMTRGVVITSNRWRLYTKKTRVIGGAIPKVCLPPRRRRPRSSCRSRRASTAPSST